MKPERPHQKAFELTVKLLDATPRTKERPPWTGFTAIGASKTDVKPDDTFGNAWLNKVKPWYKPEKLHKGLEAVAGDPNAYWMARTGAIEALKNTGGPPAAFDRLAKKYEKLDKGDDGLVKKKIDEVAKKKS